MRQAIINKILNERTVKIENLFDRNMKHIIIQIESIMKYPPTISLMKMLRELGDEVFLLSSEITDKVQEECKKNDISVINVGFSYKFNNHPLKKLIKIPFIQKSLKRILTTIYDGDTLIWIMTSVSLKFIGNILDEKKYIMYMYELSEEIRFYPRLPFPRVKLKKLFLNANEVIECEYNRAYIAQAWFGLKKTPYVMPNKPFMTPLSVHTRIQDKVCDEIIKRISNKKIILYQGIIDQERPLLPFVKAIDEMGEEYALVVMSSDIGKLKSLKSNNLYLLPFVTPPSHLEITSWAYMGILSYVPVRGETTSPLNAVYCAPNKIYEYAMFGIPMIGNNIPGLKYSIENNALGICFDSFETEDIKEAIHVVESKYDYFSKNAKNYYDINNLDFLKKVIGKSV